MARVRTILLLPFSAAALSSLRKVNAIIKVFATTAAPWIHLH